MATGRNDNQTESSISSHRVAFGVPLAGRQINWLEIIRRPEVMLRIVACAFSVIVFTCITVNGYEGERCLLNSGSRACSFSVAIGVFSFLTCMGMFASDVVFQTVSSLKRRRRIVMLDAIGGAIWAILWFVSFCQLVYNWSWTTPSKQHWRGQNGVQAAITFCFFSSTIWGLLFYVSVRRLWGYSTSLLLGHDDSQNDTTAAQCGDESDFGISLSQDMDIMTRGVYYDRLSGQDSRTVSSDRFGETLRDVKCIRPSDLQEAEKYQHMVDCDEMVDIGTDSVNASDKARPQHQWRGPEDFFALPNATETAGQSKQAGGKGFDIAMDLQTGVSHPATKRDD